MVEILSLKTTLFRPLRISSSILAWWGSKLEDILLVDTITYWCPLYDEKLLGRRHWWWERPPFPNEGIPREDVYANNLMQKHNWIYWGEHIRSIDLYIVIVYERVSIENYPCGSYCLFSERKYIYLWGKHLQARIQCFDLELDLDSDLWSYWWLYLKMMILVFRY